MKKMKYDFYIASGWFNKNQARDLKNIKKVFNKLKIKYFSPKDNCALESNASIKSQKKIFNDNLIAIKNSEFIIVNTRDKDMGTIFEAGYAFSENKKILYYYEGLVKNFNLMLSRSGIGVCTSIKELENFISQLKKNNLYKKEYIGKIE